MSIKENLYQYAYKEDYIENTKNLKLGKKESLIGCFGMLFFATLFSIPMIVEYTVVWIFITIINLLILFLNTIEKNVYLKSILNFGIIFLYFGIVIAGAIVISSEMDLRINRQNELIITMLIGFLMYDIGVAVKIILKKYSNNNQKMINTIPARSIWDFWGPLAGAGIGRSISICFGDSAWLDWVSIFFSSILVILSLMFIQKYLICKLFYNKRIRFIAKK